MVRQLARDCCLGMLVVASLCSLAHAQATVDSQSNGVDGVFNPTSNVTIDLGQAAAQDAVGNPLTWDSTYRPAGGVGKGVYDRDKWAVVFHYTSVSIPAGVTVTFTNHPSRAPIVWLAQGNVTIAGTVSVDGKSSLNTTGAGEPEPGPGGFRGSHASPDVNASGAGYGPGGGRFVSAAANTAGSHATVGQGNVAGSDYGNSQIIPLIGGSGGKRQISAYSVGSGGGAILISAGTGSSAATVTISGRVSAQGGDGSQPSCGGSGGAIRLIASTVTGSGSLVAAGTAGGSQGRIDLEANAGAIPNCSPAPSQFAPGAVAGLWPTPAQPAVRIYSVDGNLVGPDPHARFELSNRDVEIATTGAITVRIEAWNVPVDGSWTVKLRSTPETGPDTTANATAEGGGSLAHSFWNAFIAMPNGFAGLQVRAVKN